MISPSQPASAASTATMCARRGQAEAHHLDGQGKPAEPVDALGGIGDDHHALGRDGHDLLPQQGPPAALDQPQVVVELVGAVDGKIEERRACRA